MAFRGFSLFNILRVYYGDNGDATYNGGRGIDIVYGGRGDEIIRGGNGNDLLYGNGGDDVLYGDGGNRSEEHTSELQSLMRISYAVFCLKTQRRYTKQEY